MKDLLIAIKLTPMYLKVPEGYVGFVAELPGANTEGRTLQEAHDRLKEVVKLFLDTDLDMVEETLQGQVAITA